MMIFIAPLGGLRAWFATLKKMMAWFKGKLRSSDWILKKDLSENLIEKIKPISLEMKKLMSDNKYLDKIVKNGNEKAQEVADSVLSRVYDTVGFFKN